MRLTGRARRTLTALGWIAALVAVGAGVAVLPLRYDPLPVGSPWRFAWEGVVLAFAFFIATALVGRRLAGLSWNALGWNGAESGAGRFAAGTVLGVAMAAVAVGLALLSGATLGARPNGGGAFAAAAPPAVALLGAALAEELVFRGAPLSLLARAVGPWRATLILALGFGAAHVANPNATVFSTLNIACAAILLSVAFLSAGGMPLAWGLHFGWNAGQGIVFAAPVSGIGFAASPLVYTAGHHAWADGGAFGPEGGLAATIAMAGGVAVLVGRRLARPREWLAWAP